MTRVVLQSGCLILRIFVLLVVVLTILCLMLDHPGWAIEKLVASPAVLLVVLEPPPAIEKLRASPVQAIISLTSWSSCSPAVPIALYQMGDYNYDSFPSFGNVSNNCALHHVYLSQFLLRPPRLSESHLDKVEEDKAEWKRSIGEKEDKKLHQSDV